MHWWKSLFHKRALDAQLDSELRFHINELTRANIAVGMPADEARRQAILEFGGREQIKEELRDVHRVNIIENTAANLKSAFRFIRKSPSFSLAVILTLALGIGANSAVFSAIDAILLRPLPFPDGDRLMRLSQYSTKVQNPPPFIAPVRLEDWNRMNSIFQSITGYYTEDGSETSGVLPEKIKQAFVAPRFLQTLGISAGLGRDFSADEEHFGGPNAILISDRFWRSRFATDPNALGKNLRINGLSFVIVGVLPASFAFPDSDTDVWVTVPPDAPFDQSREYTWYRGIGRLKPGVTAEQAQTNLAAVQTQLGRTFPKTDADLAVNVQPLKDTIVGDARRSLWLLFVSVTVLLLIACANIIALLLARATQRRHEIAVRFSLGAGPSAIVMQLLTETFVLALMGALFGLVVASTASRIFRSLAASLPRVEEIRLDSRIVLYSLICSGVVTLLCGLFPALCSTRSGISSSLAQNSRTQVSSRNTLQSSLVGVQVALAMILLSGAGLLFRSLQALGSVSPGFDAGHVLTFRISGSYGETVDWQALTHRINRTLAELQAIPGVEAAAAASSLPGVPYEYPTQLKIVEGEQDPDHKVIAEMRTVSPGYFATMQIPVISGELCRDPQFRTLSNDQPSKSPRVAFTSLTVVVNRSFADTYLPASTALGHHLQTLDKSFIQPDQPAEIVGIVGDARESGLNHSASPTVYWCVGAPGGPDPFYIVRTRTTPATMAKTIRQKIREIEPSRSVFNISPLEEQISDAFAENRLRTVLLTFFAATAIALACVGLYGTLSYSVNTRQREIGLRLALGAVRAKIVKQFLLQGLGITLLGCVAGAVLAAAFARLLSSMLYGVSPSDAITFSSVFLLVLIVAAAASLIPAMRAARVDPMQVLREE